MELRDRLANLGLLAAAAVAWILVAVLVTTRDPYQDPMAGYIGSLLMGLAAWISAIPVLWLVVFTRHRRIAYRGDWVRATRRGAWLGLLTIGADRPFPRRQLDLRGLLREATDADARALVLPFAARILGAAQTSGVFGPSEFLMS